MKFILPTLMITASILVFGGVVKAQDTSAVPDESVAAVPAPEATPQEDSVAVTTDSPSMPDTSVDAKISVTGVDNTAATPTPTNDAVSATPEPVVTPDAIDASAALASASETLQETATGQMDSTGSTGSSDIEANIKQQLTLLQPSVDVNKMPSLFFSLWEHDLIVSSRRGLTTRPVDAPDDGTGLSTDTSAAANGNLIPSGPREIYLGGIVYISSKDWTIWLNGLRVTPTALPATVMDIKVFKDYIEMNWLDASTNRIFPIRLRTQQRFNLDTKMFLQGQG